MKVFTAFSGYDSQCMALDRLGIDYELIAWSEIDKYAIQAHNAVYPQYADRNYGDICKIDWIKVPDFDLFTYTFPCTDISSAGQQKGLTEGSGTRSSLLWECRKAIEIKRPKYLLMENVKALTSEKILPYLQKWLLFLESMGYSNFTKVLNSKDYGVPQNRERVFCVSILGDGRYYFPKPFKLEKRLKDVLESDVDENYYLSKKMIEDLTLQRKETDVGIIYEGDVNKGGQKGAILSQNGICTALTATDYKQPKQIIQFKSCAMRGRNPDNPSDRKSGIPTEQRIEIGGDIDCFVSEPKIVEPQIVAMINVENKNNEKRTIFETDYKRNTAEILSILRREIGKEENKRKIRRFICFLKEKVLQQRMYEESFCSRHVEEPRLFSCSSHSEEDSLSHRAEGESLRDMWFKKECRYTSQRWELSKQLVMEFNECMSFVPFKIAQKTKRYVCYMWKENKGTWVLQQALYSLEKIWESSNNPWPDYRIRKLTERESFRLMGVAEENIDKIQNAGISKTQQYKMAGNSIVVDVLYYIFKKLFIDKKANKGDEQILF